jgi:hypothetical protein
VFCIYSGLAEYAGYVSTCVGCEWRRILGVGCVRRRVHAGYVSTCAPRPIPLVWDVYGGGYLCGMCVEEDTCVGCVWRRILVWDVCGGGYLCGMCVEEDTWNVSFPPLFVGGQSTHVVQSLMGLIPPFPSPFFFPRRRWRR